MKHIRWNLRAFEEIRRLPGVDARIQSEVTRVLDTVGREHYDGGVEPGKSRSRGYVVTIDGVAIRDNARNHTLLRALGGGES